MLKPPTYHEPPPPLPLIDQGLQTLALKKLAALVKGNGIKPENITVESVEARILSFEAQAFVRLATHYTSQTLPGRIERGEAIGSSQAFEQALRSMTLQVQKDAGKRKIIIDTILRRPDKGYGARDQMIKLDALAKDYVSHDVCQNCKGESKTTCPKCGGQKTTVCNKCHGRHSIICPTCRATGQIFKNGKGVQCTRCRGRTRIQCPGCQGNGQIKCKNCNGAGTAACKQCNASGFISHLAKVELLGHLHFNYDRQGLPIELTKLMDAFSTRFIERKDIELSIQTGDWQENEPPENVPIGYTVRVPYGEIVFGLGKRKISCILLGWNGELTKGPDFLEDLTKKGQDDLNDAAEGRGNVGENLRAAARYKLLRDCIIVAAGQRDIRSGISKLMVKYPVGVSSDKILKFMTQAKQAMQNITAKPRLMGLMIGAVVFAGFSIGYFVFLRGILPPFLKRLPVAPAFTLIACDIIWAVLGAGLIVGVSKFMAKQALTTSLAGLASPEKIRKIMPKLGWTLGAGIGLAVAITLLLYVLFAKKA